MSERFAIWDRNRDPEWSVVDNRFACCCRNAECFTGSPAAVRIVAEMLNKLDDIGQADEVLAGIVDAGDLHESYEAWEQRAKEARERRKQAKAGRAG